MSLLIDLVRAAVERNGKQRVLVYHAGFETFTELEPYEVVDLDGDLDGAPRPDGSAAEILVLARTPTDLRRAATLQSLLPLASRVVVAVEETPRGTPRRSCPPPPPIAGGR